MTTFPNSVSSSFMKIAILILIIATAILPMGVQFYMAYNQTLEYREVVNYPKLMGILDSIDWIEKNTFPGDIFLVASGSTTNVWSMEIGDRFFASLHVVKSGFVIPYSEVEMADVVDVARDLNAAYIILDPMVKAFSLEKLFPLYDLLRIKDIGTTFPIFRGTPTLLDLSNGSSLQGLETLYVSNQKDSKVVIFKPTYSSIAVTWSDDLQNLTNWQVYLNGISSLHDGGMVLTTPPFCTDMVYAEYNFESIISITNSTLLVISVTRQDEGTRTGCYIKFKEGKSTANIFHQPGIYAVNLGEFEGLTPRLMLLYNMLSSEIAYTNSTYNVYYDWVFLGDSTLVHG